MPEADDKITIENFTSPGHVYRVNRAKYMAMRKAVMAALPSKAPGLTIADAKTKAFPRLPDDLFPGGDTAGWWFKAVQLDLEAKGVIARTKGSPLRLFKCGRSRAA
jgi:hypothetical protein